MVEVNITTVTTIKNPRRQQSVGMYLIELTDDETKTRQGYLVRKQSSSQELTIQLLANAIHIVNRLKRDISQVEVYTDEPRVAAALNNKWLDEWKENDWKTQKGKEVANADSWKVLHKEIKSLEIKATTEKSTYTSLLNYQAKKILERSKHDNNNEKAANKKAGNSDKA